jgi:hypothetical protein
MDSKDFKIGIFNYESKMQGYGKKVRRDDNQTFEGAFKNDNLLDDNQTYSQKQFNISSYS